MNEKDTFNQKMNENNHNNHVNGYEKYNIISITFEKSSMNEKDRQENRSCNPFLPLWVQCKRRKLEVDRC